MEIRYPALLEPQPDGGYCVQFVDFPDTFTEGDTLDEALFHASEVLTAMLDLHIELGDELPLPTPNVPGAQAIAPDAKTQAALLARWARREKTLPEEAAKTRLTLEGLADVEAGNVIDHPSVLAWADSLEDASPLNARVLPLE